MKGAAFLQPDLGSSVIVMALDPGGKRKEGGGNECLPLYILCAGFSLHVHGNTQCGTLDYCSHLTDEDAKSRVCS